MYVQMGPLAGLAWICGTHVQCNRFFFLPPMGCFCCTPRTVDGRSAAQKSNVSQCCGLWRFCAWRMADRADCGLRSPERETYRCAASIHIVALFCWAVEQKPRLVRASTPQTGGYVLLPPRRRPACTFVAKRREKRDDLLVGSHDADGELNWKKEQRHGAVAGARWVPVTEVFFFLRKLSREQAATVNEYCMLSYCDSINQYFLYVIMLSCLR